MNPSRRSDGRGQKPETEGKEGPRMSRIGPSQFGRETGPTVGANSASAQCGEWQEDEWQELQARLSTGCISLKEIVCKAGGIQFRALQCQPPPLRDRSHCPSRSRIILLRLPA
jgi:hypothetical protein